MDVSEVELQTPKLVEEANTRLIEAEADKKGFNKADAEPVGDKKSTMNRIGKAVAAYGIMAGLKAGNEANDLVTQIHSYGEASHGILESIFETKKIKNAIKAKPAANVFSAIDNTVTKSAKSLRTTVTKKFPAMAKATGKTLGRAINAALPVVGVGFGIWSLVDDVNEFNKAKENNDTAEMVHQGIKIGLDSVSLVLDVLTPFFHHWHQFHWQYPFLVWYLMIYGRVLAQSFAITHALVQVLYVPWKRWLLSLLEW